MMGIEQFFFSELRLAMNAPLAVVRPLCVMLARGGGGDPHAIVSGGAGVPLSRTNQPPPPPRPRVTPTAQQAAADAV